MVQFEMHILYRAALHTGGVDFMVNRFIPRRLTPVWSHTADYDYSRYIANHQDWGRNEKVVANNG
jgi:hypothetical protein